jgi:hypothetical protein
MALARCVEDRLRQPRKAVQDGRYPKRLAWDCGAAISAYATPSCALYAPRKSA